jgi:DNA-binding NarL/FixJ family response regulator
VIVTGLDPARYQERAQQAGVSTILRKPVDEGELLDALRGALARDSVD